MTDGDSLVIAKLEAAESPDPIYHKGGRKKGENGPVPMDVGKRNVMKTSDCWVSGTLTTVLSHSAGHSCFL